MYIIKKIVLFLLVYIITFGSTLSQDIKPNEVDYKIKKDKIIFRYEIIENYTFWEECKIASNYDPVYFNGYDSNWIKVDLKVLCNNDTIKPEALRGDIGIVPILNGKSRIVWKHKNDGFNTLTNQKIEPIITFEKNRPKLVYAKSSQNKKEYQNIPSKDSLKKHKDYYSLGIGSGTNYCGYGIRTQYVTPGNFFRFGTNVGTGLFKLSDDTGWRILNTCGGQLFFGKYIYLAAQIGTVGLWENEETSWNSTTNVTVREYEWGKLYGPSILIGTDFYFLKNKIGINIAYGRTYIINYKISAFTVPWQNALDIGIVYRVF